MSDQNTRKLRKQKAAEQHQHCFYCGFPMWQQDRDAFARLFRISVKEAERFHCTAEHLQARRDGGTSRVDNIVAACLFCNRGRHQRAKAPAPAQFRNLVRKRIKGLAWHHPRMHKMLTMKHADLPL